MTASPQTAPSVRPFCDHFVGTVEGDGQTAPVAALVTSEAGDVYLLSAVGLETTLGAISGRLFKKGTTLRFTPSDPAWRGPRVLWRSEDTTYRRHMARIPRPGVERVRSAQRSLRERHLVVLAECANLHTLLQTPTLPKDAQGREPPKYGLGHIILANATESAPDGGLWLGHLRALGVPFLPAWAKPLWEAALLAQLVVALPASGVQAWQLAPDPARWATWLTDWLRTGATA